MKPQRGRTLFFIIFIFLNLLSLTQSRAQEVNQKAGLAKLDLESTGVPLIFWRSVEYGVGAGFLVGLASITDFKKNFRVHSDDQNLFRGASYGLYGGILLGLYLAYVVPERSNSLDQVDPSAQLPEQTLRMNREKKIHFDPLVTEGGMLGVCLSWKI